MSTAKSPETGDLPPVALIAGPTASGKSDLAVRLALALAERGRAATVINADSAQVYTDLQVLSARPSAEEMRGVPHRMFGEWDGARACSAADWAAAAREVIDAIHSAGGVPILVGGTGLYLRTLLDGIAPIPTIDPQVRKEVRAMPTSEAFAELEREDPDRAAVIAPADATRVARALEVVRYTGRPLTAWQSELVGGLAGRIALHAAILLPDRDALYERCDRRFATMLQAGAVEEARTLLARKLEPALPVMRAIGVPEIARYLAGESDRATLLSQGAQATRNYAKRQYTWFRRQPPPEWLRVTSEHYDLIELFALLLRN